MKRIIILCILAAFVPVSAQAAGSMNLREFEMDTQIQYNVPRTPDTPPRPIDGQSNEHLKENLPKAAGPESSGANWLWWGGAALACTVIVFVAVSGKKDPVPPITTSGLVVKWK